MLIITVPSTPLLPPVRIEEMSTTSTITVELPLIENGSEAAGGSEISSYNLETNNGFGLTFSEFLGGDSGENLDRVITVPTTPGSTYLFRYRVKNILGYSESYSPVAEIKSAKKPLQPASITTSISGKNVLV